MGAFIPWIIRGVGWLGTVATGWWAADLVKTDNANNVGAGSGVTQGEETSFLPSWVLSLIKPLAIIGGVAILLRKFFPDTFDNVKQGVKRRVGRW